MRLLKETKYFVRVLISLLDGKSKTAAEIAEEWHPGINTYVENPYRKTCKEFLRRGMVSHKRYENSISKAKKYSLDFVAAAVYLSKVWKLDEQNVLKVICRKNFREFVDEILIKVKKKRHRESQILGNLIEYYVWEVKINKRFPEDFKLVKKLYDDWSKKHKKRIHLYQTDLKNKY
ncbi:hypothetical protein HYW20_07070 [Candidatus Woesearchaeota archaeon]|nr:hypothetical protein [Candidatus Woesearchaeota archaeon]